MDKLSNHLGKTIIDITTAEELGSLVAICIGDTNISHIVSSQNITIAARDIVSMGDYITVSSSGEPLANLQLATAIGQKALVSDGKSLGEIIDFEFTKTFKLKRVFCSETTQNASKISVFNQKHMIFNKKNCVKQSNSELIVKTVEETAIEVSPVTPPRQQVSDYSFLVGRIINRDIFIGTKRVFCANNIITDKIVSDAKSYNKLVELTLYSQKIN